MILGQLGPNQLVDDLPVRFLLFIAKDVRYVGGQCIDAVNNDDTCGVNEASPGREKCAHSIALMSCRNWPNPESPANE